MNKKEIIEKTKQFVKKKFETEGSGHDWWHIYRVWRNARHIGRHEKVDLFVVELGALLHDIADFKFHNGDLTVGPKAARTWLAELKVPQEIIDQVAHIVEHVSFKGSGTKSLMKSQEGKVVQDADRLDAIGAIGIARVFAFGGNQNRAIHLPDIKAKKNMSFAEYKKTESTSINHFYEKLLLLKDLMNTKTGKKLAQERHDYMIKFLEQFLNEWEGKV